MKRKFRTLTAVAAAAALALSIGAAPAFAGVYDKGETYVWTNEGKTYNGYSMLISNFSYDGSTTTDGIVAEQTVKCLTTTAQIGHMGCNTRLCVDNGVGGYIARSTGWKYNPVDMRAGNGYGVEIFENHANTNIWYSYGQSAAWSAAHQRYLVYTTGWTQRLILPGNYFMPHVNTKPLYVEMPSTIDAVATNGEYGIVYESDLVAAEGQASNPDEASASIQAKEAESIEAAKEAINSRFGAEIASDEDAMAVIGIDANDKARSCFAAAEDDSVLLQLDEEDIDEIYTQATNLVSTYVPVYASDGVTVIGELPVGSL